MKHRRRLSRPAPTIGDRAAQEERQGWRVEREARERAAQLASEAAHATSPWDQRVLEIVGLLNLNATEDKILKRLRKAGHPSLSEGALRVALRRLRRAGHIYPQTVTKKFDAGPPREGLVWRVYRKGDEE